MTLRGDDLLVAPARDLAEYIYHVVQYSSIKALLGIALDLSSRTWAMHFAPSINPSNLDYITAPRYSFPHKLGYHISGRLERWEAAILVGLFE